jgi:hypothetical protein
MVRDSRMRSLVSNETITPYSYRINGLFHTLGVSTILVTGGNGDWFDVLDACLLLDNYECIDATKRAKSISKTFCTGRVQYNGRGLVHQLHWTHDMRPRSITKYNCATGGSGLLPMTSGFDVEKLEQAVRLNGAGRRGIEAAVTYVLQLLLASPEHAKDLAVHDLLQVVDKYFDDALFSETGFNTSTSTSTTEGSAVNVMRLLPGPGPSLRPRAFEVAAALFRLRGLTFEYR